MLRAAGLDIGSRTIEFVVLASGRLVEQRRAETTYDPLGQCKRLLAGVTWSHLVATGYGRALAADAFACPAITEIQAYALGARHLFPECRSILDIGGQDTKAIALDARGRVHNFEMNDRCAAGTGRFLEFMATSFQVPIEQFGQYALDGKPGPAINSVCTVFAETEATSLMARGHEPQDIALALHDSVVRRSMAMLKRVAVHSPLVFAGGVAHNPCIRKLIRAQVNGELLVPEPPDMVGALGAALYAARKASS